MKDNIEQKTNTFQEKKRQAEIKLKMLNLIIEITEIVTGYEVLTDHRANRSPEARKLVAILARKHIHGITYSFIGGVLNRDHAAVISMINTGNNLIETDREFREFYNEIDLRICLKSKKELLQHQYEYHTKQAEKYKNILQEYESQLTAA